MFTMKTVLWFSFLGMSLFGFGIRIILTSRVNWEVLLTLQFSRRVCVKLVLVLLWICQ